MESNNIKIVTHTLQIDNQARIILTQQSSKLSQYSSDNNYDITTLNYIDFTRDWDYSLPTIYSKATQTLKNERIKDITSFQNRFNNMYEDYFSQLDFNNILIAGGSIIGCLLQQNWNNDVDIFLYGLTETQAMQKITNLIEQMYQSYRDAIIRKRKSTKHNDNEISSEIGVSESPSYYTKSSINNKTLHVDNFKRSRFIERKMIRKTKDSEQDEIDVVTIRNKYAITLIFNSRQKIQIILRLYKSISEILHGFDMGSVAIGYNGSDIYFTSLGKFSYEYLANIVDPTRRSTTYEKRLIKYYNRGFHIILPYLDITKLKVENLKYDIPEVASLPYFTFSYTKVKGNKITMRHLLEWGEDKEGNKYRNDCDYQSIDLDEYKIFYLNLKNLVRGSDDYYFYNHHMNFDILTSPPYISSSRIIDYYDNLAKRIYNESTFNIKIFSSYFSIDLLPHILTDIFLNKIGTSKLDELIEFQKNEVLNKLNSLTPDNYTLKFITKNPGTQLTSSFNPIISNIEDWYGKYLIIS